MPLEPHESTIPPYDISRFTQQQQAWIALSDLFVDTEITARDVNFIAQQLRDLQLDVHTAERILFEDVAPVFGKNLRSVAGNWTGWRPEDIVQLVTDWIHRRDASGILADLRRLPVMGWLRRHAMASLVEQDWARVAQVLSTDQKTEID